MKNKMLKLVTIMICSLLCCNAVNAAENENYVNLMKVSMSESQIETLKSLGFLDHEIETMSQEEFDKNKNLQAKLISQEIVYYKTISYIPSISAYSTLGKISEPVIFYYTEEISEREYNDPSSASSTQATFSQEIVNTEYKQMTASISQVGSYYRYKNSLEWKKEPKYRSYDIVAIGIDSTVSAVPSSKTFNMNYLLDDNIKGLCGYRNSSTVTRWKSSASGVSALVKLPSDSPNYKYSDISMYMYFNVQKLQNITINTLNAYGNYRHAQKNVSITPSFDFGVDSTGTISFGASVSTSVTSSYDSISTSHATASGINW